MSKFYDFKMTDINGNEFDFSTLKGKVVLIVNTATRWGLTPQLKALSSVYDELHDKGFELIDIPCNQFGNQTPESDAEVQHICTSTFGFLLPIPHIET